ncbi:MAG: alpha/beta fold hydrolase [Actinobacteria bacterium]|nr:alpha/beta fold hydrolase [Actinomycetota bacterium]
MVLLGWYPAHLIATLGWWGFVQNHWLYIAIIAGLALIALCLITLWRSVRLGYNIMRDTLIPLSMVSNGSEELPGQELEFRSLDGTSLRGTLIRGKQDESGQCTVVFCHEFGANKNSCLRYCKGILEAGFDVFAFDFRNHGHSSHEPNYIPRQWPTDKEVSDVLGACAFIESLHSKDHSIGLFGVSRGGGAAIMAAAQTGAVKAIITDGVFSTDWTVEDSVDRWAEIFAKLAVFYRRLPQFFRMYRWMVIGQAEVRLKCRFPSVRKLVNKMEPRPIFFIHGKKDGYIKPEQAMRIYEQAREPKFIWIVPKAKHNRSVEVTPQLYAQRTTAFFRKYLLQAATSIQDNEVFEDIAELKPTDITY